MTLLCVRLVLAVGAVEIRLRERFPRLMWLLTTTRRQRRALMSELQRLESDPEFAAQARARLDAELDQRLDRAFAELLRALTDPDAPDAHG
ncbi:hypothetical protein ACWEFL_29455 [Streptomyces sp. NPDC004838]